MEPIVQQPIPEVFPTKERLIVQRLRDFVDKDENHTIALMTGIRRIGKTTALKQLRNHYKDVAAYINLQEKSTGLGAIRTALFDRSVRVLLLDEITCLDDFEMVAEYLYNASTKQERPFKAIMTGSSAAHFIKLYQTKLGGGRSRLYRLPPITFIEYLYLTGRINSYKDYSGVGRHDFADYLLLKGLTPDLRIQFDDEYFSTFYGEVAEGNHNSRLTHSFVNLNADDLMAMTDLIAYKLNEMCKYIKTIEPKIGRTELFGIYNNHPEVDLDRIDLSDAFISVSAGKAPDIPVQNKGRILNFMLWAGLASIERKKTYDGQSLVDENTVLGVLDHCTQVDQLEDLFKKVSICLTTPLFYTRLGANILEKMDIDVEELCSGGLLGKMLEVYVRGAYTLRSTKPIMVTLKLDYPGIGEVDIYDSRANLLCEITTTNDDVNLKVKKGRLQRYFPDMELIRVGTTGLDEEHDGACHLIPYPKFCCMMDVGAVYKLPHTKGVASV